MWQLPCGSSNTARKRDRLAKRNDKGTKEKKLTMTSDESSDGRVDNLNDKQKGTRRLNKWALSASILNKEINNRFRSVSTRIINMSGQDCKTLERSAGVAKAVNQNYLVSVLSRMRVLTDDLYIIIALGESSNGALNIPWLVSVPPVNFSIVCHDCAPGTQSHQATTVGFRCASCGKYVVRVANRNIL